jgi:hypothetical protein
MIQLCKHGDGVMKNPQPANESRDFGFCLALAICNCIGYLLSTIPLTIVDPLLESHVRFGARSYPYAWWIWPISVCVMVGTFKLTYFIKSRLLRLAGATGVFAFFCGVSLLIFKPEMPHCYVIGNATIWVSITAGWILIRYFLFSTGNADLIKVDKKARIQFIREQLDFSKLLFLTLVGAYIGLIVGWLSAAHTNIKDVVPVARERFLVDVLTMFQVCTVGLYFLFGPIFELGKQRRRMSALFLAIPTETTPQPQTDVVCREGKNVGSP